MNRIIYTSTLEDIYILFLFNIHFLVLFLWSYTESIKNYCFPKTTIIVKIFFKTFTWLKLGKFGRKTQTPGFEHFHCLLTTPLEITKTTAPLEPFSLYNSQLYLSLLFFNKYSSLPPLLFRTFPLLLLLPQFSANYQLGWGWVATAVESLEKVAVMIAPSNLALIGSDLPNPKPMQLSFSPNSMAAPALSIS